MTIGVKLLSGVLAPTFIGRWFADRRSCCERSRQALSAYASHDLRSPMATLRDAAALLADGVPGEINEKQRRLLTIILERAETWLRLVDEVLVLPRWVAEGSALHIREESLREVAYESIGKTKGLALLREVTVNVAIPDTLPTIMVDRLRLVQALTMLLATVISSTRQGGRVRLSATLLSETEVQVMASGMGAAGTVEEGAAMSAVRAVVEAHGGRLCASFDETANESCAFTLPLRAGVTRKERSHGERPHY